MRNASSATGLLRFNVIIDAKVYVFYVESLPNPLIIRIHNFPAVCNVCINPSLTNAAIIVVGFTYHNRKNWIYSQSFYVDNLSIKYDWIIKVLT